MSFILEPLQYAFMARGLAAAVLAGMLSMSAAENPGMLPGIEPLQGIVFTVIVATIIFTTIGFYFSTNGKKSKK